MLDPQPAFGSRHSSAGGRAAVHADGKPVTGRRRSAERPSGSSRRSSIPTLSTPFVGYNISLPTWALYGTRTVPTILFQRSAMGAIKCYGDFWNRDLVNWVPGSSGRALWGRRRKAKADKVDFRHQIGVYVLFTKQREIVYVGQTGSGEKAALYSRLRRHRFGRLRDRWTHFSWFGVRAVTEELALADFENQGIQKTSVLNELEGILLHLVEPRLNRQGPRWEGATEYVQWYDKDPADLELEEE